MGINYNKNRSPYESVDNCLDFLDSQPKDLFKCLTGEDERARIEKIIGNRNPLDDIPKRHVTKTKQKLNKHKYDHFIDHKRKGRIVTYDKLKFPLRPFIQLKTKEMEDFFGVPYNYLIEGEIFSAGTDNSNQGAKFVIRDPDFGEVTDILSKMAHETLTQNEPAQIELKWGWCDANGTSYTTDRAWTLRLKHIDATIDTFGATFKMELFWNGLKTLYSSIGNHVMDGIEDNLNAAQILYKIIDNYNDYVGWEEIVLVPSIEVLPGEIRGAFPLNGYDPGNKTLIEIIKELTGFMNLSKDWDKSQIKNWDSYEEKDERYRIVPEILVSDTTIDPNSKDEKVGSEIHLLYRKDSSLLETMYAGSTYYYLHSEKSNILEFNLKYNSWITLLGNIEQNITNKQKGIWEAPSLNSKKNIKKTIAMSNYQRLQQSELMESPSTVINGPIDVDAINNRTSKDTIGSYTKAVLEKINENLVTGSIVILGDPNIYDPIEALNNKHIHIRGGINNKGSNIKSNHQKDSVEKRHFFDGKYLIKGFLHSFSGQKWTTKLELVKVYNEDGKAKTE